MIHLVQDSKWQAETISIILSFADMLADGDFIVGTPTVTISVFTGVDANPSSLLYQGVTVTGSDVEQRIRLGVPGNIYSILYTVQTDQGDTLEKDCYLAILPDEDSAVPLWLPVWESTQLYPYQAGPDYVQCDVAWTAGRLTGYRIPTESIVNAVEWEGGNLVIYGAITYNIPHEDVQSAPEWLGGTLVVYGSIQYDVPYEGVTSNVAWLGGTLVGVGIEYDIPYEAIQNDVQWLGGTLT